LREVKELPEGSPDWLLAKWPEGGPYHLFVPDNDLNENVRHVADWIKVSVQDKEPWVANADNKGRPTRLLHLRSLKDAIEQANEDMRVRNERLAAQLVPENTGEEMVAAMADGFRIVRLLTVEALDREGVCMGHCIGQGGYDEKLKDGSLAFFSLRDAKNQPHATLEVDTKAHAVLQCQGKENKAPVERYLPYLQAFLKKQKYRLDAPASRTGLVQAGDEYHNISNLPDNLQIDSNLDLSGTQITRLPDGLQVSGSLYLRGTQITQLPDGLQVGRNLYLGETQITQLPDDAIIGGMVYGLKTWIERAVPSRTNTNNVDTTRYGRG